MNQDDPEIRALLERVQRAELIASQIIEAITLAPDSAIVVVRVKNGTNVDMQPLANELARIVPPGGLCVVLDENTTLEVLDDDRMLQHGWVRIAQADQLSPDKVH